MKVTSFLILFSLFFIACNESKLQPEDFDEVRTLLKEQENAWNEGDIKAFMEGYWNSDSLRFISSGNLKLGWQETIDRYYKTYPNKEAMGKLRFDVIDTYPISNEAIGLSGAYHLSRNIGDLDGYFSLIFRKIENHWKIISDMTCAN